MNIETLIPIVMTIIGICTAYTIGFGFGRRSAYKDVDMNIEKPQSARLSERPIVAKGLITTTQMFK